MSCGTVRIAAYAIVRDDDRVLVCRLAPTASGAGLWTFPGGGLEFGEHPESAVIREVEEETGLKVKIVGPPRVESEVFDRVPPPMQALRLIYEATIVGGNLQPEQSGSTDLCRWVKTADLPKLPLVGMVRRSFGCWPKNRR